MRPEKIKFINSKIDKYNINEQAQIMNTGFENTQSSQASILKKIGIRPISSKT